MKPTDKVLLSSGVLAALMLVVAAGSALTGKAPSHHVVATVVDMGIAGARFPRTVVVARAPKSLVARASLREGDAEICRIGDLVDGEQTGISLVINPYTCRRPQKAPRSGPSGMARLPGI